MPARLLIIEDEKNARLALEKALGKEGYEILLAEDGVQGLQLFRDHAPDFVLCDIVMPGKDGMEVLKEVMREKPGTPFVIMTAFGTVGKAVEAMKAGALDFIEKPIDLAEVRRIVKSSLEIRRLISDPALPLTGEFLSAHGFEGWGGAGPALQEVMKKILRVGPTKATVLVTGESGTGKSLVARALHRNSPMREKPIVTVDCAALAPTLAESELFGHVAGAFTGADRTKIGYFEAADGSTLFLDEVGELPLPLQVKLLRFLQDHTFERVGSVETRKSSVRLIAATNRALPEAIKEGKFRQDLYYRLNVVELSLPPLRQRSADILPLARHFLEKFSRQYGKPAPRLAPAAEPLLLNYSWPGNIRELEHAIESALLLAPGPAITPALLPLQVRQEQFRQGVVTLPVGSTMDEVEKSMILATLDSVGGNKTKAARLLGIGLKTLYRKLESYGLPAEEGTETA